MRRIGRVLAIVALVGVVAIATGAACAHNNPSPLPVPQTTVICPPLKAYTADQEKALGAAVAALPAGSPLVGAMADYGALRSAVRACGTKTALTIGLTTPSLGQAAERAAWAGMEGYRGL